MCIVNIKIPLFLAACVAAAICLTGCVATATQINTLDAQGCATPTEFEDSYDVFVQVFTDCEVASDKQQLAGALGLGALYVPRADVKVDGTWLSPVGNNCVLLVATDDNSTVAIALMSRFSFFETLTTGAISVRQAKDYIDAHRESLCVELPTI